MKSKESPTLFMKMAILAPLAFTLSLFIGIHVGFTQEGDWSDPIGLSSREGEAGEPHLVADDYGFVHLFWTEDGFIDDRTIIQYARFFDGNWTSPIDIYVSQPGSSIRRMTLDIDQDQNLHLFFSVTSNTYIHHYTAPAHAALSAQAWEESQVVDISARDIVLKIDSDNVFHLLYSVVLDDRVALFSSRSSDIGETWTEPVLIDSDSAPNLLIERVRLAIDAQDRLHSLWQYNDNDRPSYPATVIKYSRSKDGGKSWSFPSIIDTEDEEEGELRLPNPTLSVYEDQVHVIWAGDSMTHREHRISNDGGVTWGETNSIFGDLHGQAIGDGVAFDPTGRLHFFGQIRWPAAIYHAIWDDGEWSEPSSIYLIAETDEEYGITRRIHAHRVRLSISKSNYLIVAFTNSNQDPQSILYVMTHPVTTSGYLPRHVTSTPTQDEPTATTTPTLIANSALTGAEPATPRPVNTEQPQFSRIEDGGPAIQNNQMFMLAISLVPSLSFLAIIIIWKRLKH